MDKKYQVFVSSTYKDLIDERQKVIEALLGKNCFPVGMEYFPAANEDQFTVIKKLIDSCDYYVLIIGGRYGSIEPKSGKSYTQLEFEYALSKGIPVVSFYHKDINNLTGDKLENTDEGRKKLEEFKDLVQTKLCDHWESAYELAFKVNKSLDYLFENNPRTGWLPATMVSSPEAKDLIYKLKDENEMLRQKIKDIDNNSPQNIENLQQGEDSLTISIHYTISYNWHKSNITTTWETIISCVSPWLMEPLTETELFIRLANTLLYKAQETSSWSHKTIYIEDEHIQIIKIQLIALGIIKKNHKDHSLAWELTSYGYNYMMKTKALKKQLPPQN